MTAAQELLNRLPAVLGPALGLGAADVTIDNLRVLAYGSYRTTLAFDAITPRGRRALILYAAPSRAIDANMEHEARAQVVAAAAGVPVPHVLAADDSPVALGNPFLICDMVKGETDGFHIIRQLDSADGQAGRARLLRQCAQALAAIHHADTDGAELARKDQLVQCRGQLHASRDTTATFAWATRWLSAHRPPPSPAVLIHGDYRMGNLGVDGSGLTAVLDWQQAHIGEAYEDLAWFCSRASRFGAPASLGAGGLGNIESFLCAYEEASGTTVDRVSFSWWLVLATLRAGVIDRIVAQAQLTKQLRSVELATMGRRVCEAEWDLLNMLDPAQQGGFSIMSGDPQHGRPMAAKAIAVVARFLETDVRDATSGQLNDRVEAASAVLRIVERELLDTGGADARAALAALGFANEAQLADAIRYDDLDHSADDVAACLRALVRHRLAVAHPGYESE